MKMRLIAIFFGFVLSNFAMAGGSLGGGTGSKCLLLLDLERMSITHEQFSALIEAGADDFPVTINSSSAKVISVDFQNKKVELEIEGERSSTMLQVQE